MNTVLNGIKTGYLKAVQWVDDNPQKSLWFATAAIIAVLVLT